MQCQLRGTECDLRLQIEIAFPVRRTDSFRVRRARGLKVPERNREIAKNESERQTVGDIRVSVWAIGVAVIIGLAAFGWVLLNNR